MRLPRRKFLHLAGGAAALPIGSRIARAQSYPTRPLRFVIGYPPGGTIDFVARLIGRWLSERLGQPVVVENKPGAGTNLAVQAVLAAPPDGYTLLLAVATNAINASLYESLPFNFLHDIAPVAGLVELPLVMEVNPAVPVRSIAELIAYGKANPGRINMASFGGGTIAHLAIELFKTMTDTNMVHVPYRGGAVMVADLIAGQVQGAVDALPNSLPHIRSGSVRALALLTNRRTHVLPDLPTVAETIPGYEVRTWSGVGVPRGTPPEIIATLNREINAGLADANVQARFVEVGGTPIILTPAAFGKLIADDTEKWAEVVKRSGAKPE
jgi:tripartite-type tricarboxylate transporter receptor subunit TctC